MRERERVIHASEATVSRLTADLTVIRVGTRQMTQILFKQLQEAPITDLYGNLLGEPWGWVNYHMPPENCPWTNPNDRPRRKHRHLVWQLGGELRKASFVEPRPDDDLTMKHRTVDEYVAIIQSLDLVTPRGLGELAGHVRQLRLSNVTSDLGAKDYASRIVLKPGFASQRDARFKDLQRIEPQIEEWAEALIEVHERELANWERFMELPHLFIGG